jgi:hypothetical protein
VSSDEQFLPGGEWVDSSAAQLQKFEVRRASRDIIHYGGATMYEVHAGASEEGEGMKCALHNRAVSGIAVDADTDNTIASTIHPNFRANEEFGIQ